MTKEPSLKRNNLLLLLAVTAAAVGAFFTVRSPAQNPAGAAAEFDVREVMVPMRDGIKLHATVYSPRMSPGPLPIILLRTPYGISGAPQSLEGRYKELADDGYIFAFQDIRGRLRSEGTFVMHAAGAGPRGRRVDRRGHGRLRYDRLARQERRRKQRAGGHARRLLRRLADGHGPGRTAPGAAGGLAPGARPRTCGWATTSSTTAPSG